MEKLLVKKKENFKDALEEDAERKNNSKKSHKIFFNFIKKNSQQRENLKGKKTPKNNKNLNKNANTKKLKKRKNSQKIPQNIEFLHKIKANCQHFLIFCILFIVSIALVFLTFLKSDYYDFLKRPKVVESSVSVIVLLLLSLAFLFCLFNFTFLEKDKSNDNHPIKNSNSKKASELNDEQSEFAKNKNESIIVDFQNFENDFANTKMQKNSASFALTKPKILYKNKLYKMRNKIKLIFNAKSDILFYEFFLLFCVFITLFFKIKILCLCVVFSFAQAVVCILNTQKSLRRSMAKKILSILLLLVSICILSTFYMIYMLN